MAVFVRPDSDQSNNNWTSAPLWSKINTAIPDDTPFIQSENDPANDIFEVTLENQTDPAQSIGHIVRYRMQKGQTGGGQPGTINAIVGLYEATTLIASQTESAVATGFATFSFTLSAGEADSITDYDDLRVRVDADKSAGARTSWLEVSGIEFETPSAAAVLEQTHFRVRDEDVAGLNDNAGGDWAGLLDANVSIDLETRFRIRFEIDETVGTSDTDTYELWAKIGAAAYAKVGTTPLNWDTVFTHLQIEHVDSKQYVNSDATTDILSGADAFTAGDGVEEGGVTDSITLNAQHTEIEFCLLLHRVADGTPPLFLDGGTLIDFRVRKADDSVLDTYTNTPQITVNEPAGLVGGAYPENPGMLGPYEDGNGNKYAGFEHTPSSGTGNSFAMMKSTDDGDTWAPQDNANRPTISDIEGCHLIQDAANDRLLVFIHRGPDVEMSIFNTSDNATPDDWITIDEVIDTITDAGDQQITGWVRSDGSVVALYTANTATVKEIWANIRSAPPTPTWGTSFKVWDLANNDNEGVVSVLGDNDNVYAFSIDQVTGDLLGKTVRGSDDAVRDLFDVASAATATGTVVDANVGTTSDERQNHTQPQYWNDGADKVFIAWKSDDATPNAAGSLEGVVITVGTSGSVGSVGGKVNDIESVAISYGGSRQVLADIIRHSNGDFHAFFATNSATPPAAENNNLQHAVSTDDGATWGADDTVTVRSTKSRINWIRAFEQPDGNIGLYYDDASGTEQNNTAAGGDDAIDIAGTSTGFIWYDEFVIGAVAVYPPFPRRQKPAVRM